METITFKPAYSSIKHAGRGPKLTGHDFSLINNISLILELIIRNTLKFNKLTSADEIYEDMAYLQNYGAPESESGGKLDIKSIESICEVLCVKNGILIKLEKNLKVYYKLKYKENI